MNSSPYNRQNPFLASIKERYSLSRLGSKKNTQHLVIDLSGSSLQYQVGDSLGVFPKHASDLVKKTLNAMKMTGEERVKLKQSDDFLSLEEFLTMKGNITDVSPKFLRAVMHKQPESEKKHALQVLLQEENRDALKNYLEKHEVWDFLQANEEVFFSPQDYIDLLMPLLPRFYSISSSQKFVGDEVHLTISAFEYESNGHKRRGVSTHYLCELAPLREASVPIFIQSSHGFHLPEDINHPMIMVGPGTGIAPFRAFMQERLLYAKSKGKHWLFFGECHRAYDFFYEEDWNALSQWGHLRLELAFSRDQEHKVYVQHKMWEHGEELYEWLEQGAHLYVCGDAQRMAKDVEATLHAIVQEFGKKDPQSAKEYIKNMRQQKRYLRDVY